MPRGLGVERQYGEVGKVQQMREVEHLFMVEILELLLSSVVQKSLTCLKMPAPPDTRQGADNHDGEDENEGDSRGVGPTAHQAKHAGLASEHPLPEGVIVFTGTRLSFWAARRPVVASLLNRHRSQIPEVQD